MQPNNNVTVVMPLAAYCVDRAAALAQWLIWRLSESERQKY